jgi:hypothetical protein
MMQAQLDWALTEGPRRSLIDTAISRSEYFVLLSFLILTQVLFKISGPVLSFP